MKKFNSREFTKLNEMVKEYLSHSRRNDLKIRKLGKIDFMSFIYNLDSGRYGESGFSNKGFLRNIGINQTNSDNWVTDIINRLSYSVSDFIQEMEFQSRPRDKNGIDIQVGTIIEIPKFGECEIMEMKYQTFFEKDFYWGIVYKNSNDKIERLNDFDFEKSKVVETL